MLNSYKFDSREYPLELQEPEMESQKAPQVPGRMQPKPAPFPFAIAEPTGDTLSISKPSRYQVTLKRETRATRSVMYLWTGDVPTDGQGFRVLGTGKEGTLHIPPDLAKNLPNVMRLRLAAMNANGKVYLLDRVFRLTR